MQNINIYNQDCFEGMKTLLDNSVDCIITDPPYFLEGMGDDWDAAKLDSAAKASKSKMTKALPEGMKFDVKQGKAFGDFMYKLSLEAMRVLKPGGFYLSFSQARLYHRLGVALEDAGFEIRDMISWIRSGQPKAFTQNHFVRKMKISEEEKERLITSMAGRKTPQLGPWNEPIVLAQKPKEGTFVNNWDKWGVGLIDTSQTLDGKFPTNVIEVKKPSGQERIDAGGHLTVKPVMLLEHLIKLFTTEGQVVLDPFLGSGSTAVACRNTNRSFVGFELEQKFAEIAIRRSK